MESKSGQEQGTVPSMVTSLLFLPLGIKDNSIFEIQAESDLLLHI